jgi:hypothetical protein
VETSCNVDGRCARGHDADDFNLHVVGDAGNVGGKSVESSCSLVRLLYAFTGRCYIKIEGSNQIKYEG